ncbi:MAG: helix-turn-helix transcriptional regulator [Salinivirgaceae bacterium]|nr:helix-turn-helix transcriptional regulator [Salinivirgaceae bacterium]
MDYKSEIKQIALKIKSSRQEKKLSVQDLAYLCDMERSSMSRIESWRINITIKTLCIISNALGVEPKDLL